jgi:hypothetical protein
MLHPLIAGKETDEEIVAVESRHGFMPQPQGRF